MQYIDAALWQYRFIFSVSVDFLRDERRLPPRIQRAPDLNEAFMVDEKRTSTVADHIVETSNGPVSPSTQHDLRYCTLNSQWYVDSRNFILGALLNYRRTAKLVAWLESISLNVPTPVEQSTTVLNHWRNRSLTLISVHNKLVILQAIRVDLRDQTMCNNCGFDFPAAPSFYGTKLLCFNCLRQQGGQCYCGRSFS
ncbi:hypothetical protein RvY_01377 [Ramazzottius varieornatus]|uniref:Uncharacterized protein n=1 Tax=Ramazzottius varieornatus TaxID=947166 RepID=A0A1D1UG46_RAMVA|nr:hypothetical protein RvY_01377 [Ramazzottius varieornatus]